MKVLVACEESQRVCAAFRRLGHEAYSCDIQDCSGGYPEWHIKQDVLPLINGRCIFTTCDGTKHTINGRWDLLIAHPPCTYLSSACTSGHSLKTRSLQQISDRTARRIESELFFMAFINADCDRIAVENPVGVMNTVYRKPDQIIHPYYFGDPELKRTCLWLKNLPVLCYADTKIEKPKPIRVGKNGKNVYFTEGCSANRKSERSKTFPGIARAMAEQWGKNPAPVGAGNGIHKRINFNEHSITQNS